MSEPTTTTKTTSWPHQILLPGQAAAPAGPVDMATMYLLHHAFRRDLAHFEAAADRTPVTARGTWLALADRWSFFAAQLHHHHTVEDDHLWPVLQERTDDAGRVVLDAMQAEPELIDPVLDACHALFTRLRTTADETARGALAEHLRSASTILGDHLGHEESAAIPIVQQTVSNREWQRLEKEKFQTGVSVKDLAAIVPWASYQVPESIMTALAPSLPLPMRLLLRLTAGGFARREREAFAFVPAAA